MQLEIYYYYEIIQSNNTGCGLSSETYLQNFAEEVNRENFFNSDIQCRWSYLLASLKCNQGEIMRIREQFIKHRLPQNSAIIGRYELIEDLSQWYRASNSQLE